MGEDGMRKLAYVLLLCLMVYVAFQPGGAG